MDCAFQREIQDVKNDESAFSLTFQRPQRWSEQEITKFDPRASNPTSNFAFSNASFTQQLNSVESISDNENSAPPPWTATAPPYPSYDATFNGNADLTSHTTSTPWASTTATAPSYYASNSNPESVPTSTFLEFGSLGADPFNLESVSRNAYQTMSLNDGKPTPPPVDLDDFERDFNAIGTTGPGSDEHNTIINLSHFPSSLQDPIDLSASSYYRRRSSSSFLSSSGPMMDPPDISTCPDSLSYASDLTPQSSVNLSSTSFSPVQYSRRTPQEMIRSSSRGKTTPSPRPNARANPYPIHAIREHEPSPAPVAAPPARRPSSYPSSGTENPVSSAAGHSQADIQPTLYNPMPSSNRNPALQYTPFSGVPRFHQPIMPPSTFDPASRIETVPYMLSNGVFRTLQSNALPGSHVHDHFCDHGDPPDLFGPLAEEQLVPPLADMKPDDPELTPHEQEVRFEGDLYTPRFVRGHGNKREGWCGICKPGRWLVLKNSAYWYDKSFSHGVSAASGQAFEGPRETRRMDGNADVWEGLCGSCHEWIALVSSKKKGTTWFRHAYKCHTHSKVKDAPKRRRESHHHGSATPSSMALPTRASSALLPNSSLIPMYRPNGRIETVTPFRPVSSMI